MLHCPSLQKTKLILCTFFSADILCWKSLQMICVADFSGSFLLIFYFGRICKWFVWQISVVLFCWYSMLEESANDFCGRFQRSVAVSSSRLISSLFNLIIKAHPPGTEVKPPCWSLHIALLQMLAWLQWLSKKSTNT